MKGRSIRGEGGTPFEKGVPPSPRAPHPSPENFYSEHCANAATRELSRKQTSPGYADRMIVRGTAFCSAGRFGSVEKRTPLEHSLPKNFYIEHTRKGKDLEQRRSVEQSP